MGLGMGMEMGLGMGSWPKRCSFAGVIKLRFSDGTENREPNGCRSRGHWHFNELMHLASCIRPENAPLCIYLFALALIVFAFVRVFVCVPLANVRFGVMKFSNQSVLFICIWSSAAATPLAPAVRMFECSAVRLLGFVWLVDCPPLFALGQRLSLVQILISCN